MSVANVRQSVRFLFQNSGRLVAFLVAAILAVKPADAAPIAWAQRTFRGRCGNRPGCTKPVLVSVGHCSVGRAAKMHSETFPNAAFAAQVNSQFIPVLIDADEQPAVVQKLGVDSFPTVLVISPEQKIVGRFTGFQTAPQLQSRLAAFQPRIVESAPLLAELMHRPQRWRAPVLERRAATGAPDAPYPQPPESEPREAGFSIEEPRPHPPESDLQEARLPFHRRAWAAIQSAHPRSTLEAAEEFSTGR